MTHSIQITHTGSLPRSPRLTALLTRAAHAGERTDEVRTVACAAVRDVVAQQRAVGIDIVSDGEQGKVSFSTYMPERMSGFGGASEREWPSELKRFPRFAELLMRRVGGTESASADPPAAVADVRYHGEGDAEHDCAVLRDALVAEGHDPRQAFMTAPSPGIIATTMRNRHYDSYEAYVRALGRELAKEYRVIADRGLVLQIDAPDLAMERGMYFQDRPLSEFLEAVELHVDVLNEAIAGIAPDRIRLHCCWGNNDAPHTDDVPLGEILSIVTRANVGALGVAFGNPRHQHEVDLVAERGLPAGMKLIAGVIDVTTNYVEHPEVVSRRVQAAVRAVGDPDRVIASPDCGFGTFAGYELVASDVAWEKFRSLRAGVDLAQHAL